MDQNGILVSVFESICPGMSKTREAIFQGETYQVYTIPGSLGSFGAKVKKGVPEGSPLQLEKLVAWEGTPGHVYDPDVKMVIELTSFMDGLRPAFALKKGNSSFEIRDYPFSRIMKSAKELAAVNVVNSRK